MVHDCRLVTSSELDDLRAALSLTLVLTGMANGYNLTLSGCRPAP
jgi:hypothetical protein